jgi:hypothetical protein
MQSLYHANLGLRGAATDHNRKVLDNINLLIGETIEFVGHVDHSIYQPNEQS